MGEQAADGDEQQLKQRAMRRLAVALALIAAAIVGLAVLDHYAGGKKAVAPAAPSTEPPPIATLPEPKPLEPAEPEPPSAEEPAAEVTPTLPPPPPPTIGDDATEPAPAGQAPARAQRAAGAEVPESTGGPGPAQIPGAPPAAGKPVGRQSAAAPPLEPRQGFVVQLGVFTTVENAQSLQSKLKEQGIPVFLETRVVVGPFRDRAEAEAAQRKLKELGVGGVIVQRK
jgi:cell division septation protein DedD